MWRHKKAWEILCGIMHVLCSGLLDTFLSRTNNALPPFFTRKYFLSLSFPPALHLPLLQALVCQPPCLSSC